MGEIRVAPGIAIDESEISEEFVRSSGPGGQNVNKVSTAVQLRFDVAHSPSLPDDVRHRLLNLAAGQISTDGVLQITAQEHRTQSANRRAARERLAALVRQAAQRPRRRRRTRPTRSSVERRLDRKRRRSETKRRRAWRGD
ncbi:MAG: aminoacyl-tRNA hydrolase [Chloroflexi bacterium]|nr:aminoacyl-tRNA hydrolase [Chloroflexota bacterium]